MGVPTYPTQDWTEDLYESTHVADTDLQNIEKNFATLKNSYAGTSAPANAKPGLAWFDTTKKIMKVRNQADSAWLGVMYGTTSYKVWVYINAAGDGWVIDSSITDAVLALKGGSQAYNRTGGGAAGTWTVANHTHTLTTSSDGNHVHKIRNHTAGGTTEQVYNSGGSLVGISRSTTNDPESGYAYGIEISRSFDHGEDSANRNYDAKDWYSQNTGAHQHTATTVGSGGTSTYRPYAAVGTMQYPNV